jgi:hypothetical protein
VCFVLCERGIKRYENLVHIKEAIAGKLPGSLLRIKASREEPGGQKPATTSATLDTIDSEMLRWTLLGQGKGNYSAAGKDGIDIVMGTIGVAGGPVGFAISGLYFLVDQTIGWDTFSTNNSANLTLPKYGKAIDNTGQKPFSIRPF